jgi:hypothetical protein
MAAARSPPLGEPPTSQAFRYTGTAQSAFGALLLRQHPYPHPPITASPTRSAAAMALGAREGASYFSDMTADSIARLNITLDDVEPKVVRRIEVPLAIRLDRLHMALQAAMGWTDSHLYEIRAGDVGWGVPDRDWGHGPLDARKARLVDVLEDVGVKTLRYLYDFGDGWEHTIKIERITEAMPGVAYPRLIEATGRCPPEDIGGPGCYGEILEAIANPAHECHAEWVELIGETFDPHLVNQERHAEALEALANQWTRKTSVKRKRAT